MKQKHSVTIEELGITINTGSIARLANGAVTISKGETTLFVSATAAEDLRSPDQDFFPLTVDYREKFAAAGRFPGGYFRREGKPSDKEILTSRLCDRPLRPLFPEGFLNEVQVIGLLLSADQINDSDVLMVNGASAALLCSDIPWNGPIAGIRLGRVAGQFVVNPTHEQQYESDLDLFFNALPHVLAAAPQTRFVVVGGDAAEILRMRAALAQAGIDQNVAFPGRLPPSELAALLAISDVLVSPRRAGVTAPIKVLDYLHSGTPIVAVDTPANRAVLSPKNALITRPTPEALAGGILKLCSAPGLCAELGLHGQSTLKHENRTPHAFRSALRRCYDYVLATP
jgi:glycosyltransferase involved in cell wall biosynthesis